MDALEKYLGDFPVINADFEVEKQPIIIRKENYTEQS